MNQDESFHPTTESEMALPVLVSENYHYNGFCNGLYSLREATKFPLLRNRAPHPGSNLRSGSPSSSKEKLKILGHARSEYRIVLAIRIPT